MNPVGIVGGAERVLLEAFGPIQSLEPDAVLGLIAGSDGPLVARAARAGVQADVVPMPTSIARLGDSGLARGAPSESVNALIASLRALPNVVSYARALALAIRAFRPDIIHSNGIKTHLVTAFVTPRHTPIVWHIHDFLSDRRLVSRALRPVAPLATLAIANSNAVAEDARHVLGNLPVKLIYNGIDVDFYSPVAIDGAFLDALAVRPAAPDGTVRVGLVATYARWKGHKLFLEAAARVLRNFPGRVRFYIIGGPVYQTAGSQFTQAELRETARALGICEHIAFVPFLEDARDAFRALDIVVHASTRREPFGMSIVEAMATGRAVIVARDGGATELFTHGVDALGFSPGDSESLSHAILGLLGAPDDRARLGEAARRTAVERFSSNRLGAELVFAYRQLIAQKAPGNNHRRTQTRPKSR